MTPIQAALAAAELAATASRQDRPGDVHVVPCDPGEPEHVESAGCWCSPDFDSDADFVVWAHHPAERGPEC